MDEIYALINEEARKIGIQGVPVEFGRGDFPIQEKSWASEMEKVLNSRFQPKREIIATYGKLPELKTKEQRSKWFNKDHGEIISGLGENFTRKYFIPAGPLVGLGSDPDGYIEVRVYKNMTVNKKLLDEIYGKIDEEAKQAGIEEVPVIFVFGDIVRTDLPATVKDSNNSAPAQENKGTPIGDASGKSVPGFGLLGGLITLLYVWLFRRK
jgi:hypothetical protein